MPVVSNFIGSKAEPIDSRHDLWKGFLPHNRDFSAETALTAANHITYGDYFSAAQKFLTGNNCRHLRKALVQFLDQEVLVEDIQRIDLHLVKHGKYYHPSRVEVMVRGRALSMALNVAVSSEGQEIIAKEYSHLKRLNAEFPISFLPKVYAFDEIEQPGGFSVKMFLGEWFDDFHEFHLSERPSDSNTRSDIVLVWDETRRRLDELQTRDLLQKASMILTFYYNPETSEQIFPWHHAAGDFVIKIEERRLSLKLITVRGYAPLLDGDIDSDRPNRMPEKIMEGLLLFFVHLSLRMRIDRLDGVGDPALYAEAYIPAIVKGFLQGLDLAGAMRGYPDNFCNAAKAYLGKADNTAVEELAKRLIARYTGMDSSGVLKRLDISKHLQSLRTALLQ